MNPARLGTDMTDHFTGNLFLDAFSSETLEALGGETSYYDRAHVLSQPDSPPPFVHFPHAGAVISVVRSTVAGGTVEAGVVGSEGFSNVHSVITAPAPTRTEGVVQIAGDFTRIISAHARSYFQSDSFFRDRALAYTSIFLNQVTQHAVCNRLHPIEQRLAKWLLTMRDRAKQDELHLTHEFLSQMLGIHRPGVSIAIAALEIDAVIEHGRNRIVIRDREELLQRACECYEVLHHDLVKLRNTLTS
jgi:hypothetical protein